MILLKKLYRLIENVKQKTYRIICVAIVSLAALFSMNPYANADILRVDGSGGSCSGNGSGWGSSAFLYLQDALNDNNLAPGDQIWVKAGTYYSDQDCANPTGSGSRSASFSLVNGVKIYGGFKGNEMDLSDRRPFEFITILSGDLDQDDTANLGNYSDNSYHVVSVGNVANTTLLSGFIIRGGNADGLLNDGLGGGIFILKGIPYLPFVQ